MSQATVVIADGSGAIVEAEINAALMAMTTQQSGASAPSPSYAYMFWADTNTGFLKMRDATNAFWIVVGPLAGFMQQLRVVSFTPSSNTLVCTLQPCSVDFRSTTLASGAITPVPIPAAISLTVAQGATLGTASGVPANLAILAINNAGAAEVAIVNTSGISLDENTLISTTALSGASNSPGVIYSTIARASVPFRIMGYCTISQVTAGTWASNPTLTKGASFSPGGSGSGSSSAVTGLASYTSTGSISSADLGKIIWSNVSAVGQILTFNAVSGFQPGQCYYFVNPSAYPVTLKGNSAELIYAETPGVGATSANTFILNSGDSCCFVCDASASWKVIPYSLMANFPVMRQQVFTTSGTFTIPNNVSLNTVFKVTAVGGGGAGGGNDNTPGIPSGAGGGGSGGLGIQYFSGWVAGKTIGVTIGSAGAGASGVAGGYGGATSVQSGTQTISTLSTVGGNGGAKNGTGSTGGAAGGSSGSLWNCTGNRGATGEQGVSGSYLTGGDGGAGFFGGKGQGAGVGAGFAASANSGAGGGGGGWDGGSVSNLGGNGGAGIVIFEWVA